MDRLHGGLTTKDLDHLPIAYNKDVDLAIPKVLDFLRLWAGFHFPRLLRVVDRIQSEILRGFRVPFGDYSFFASQVQNLFLDSTMLALEEYGVPLELSRKITPQLQPDGDLDGVLRRLKNLDSEALSLSAFEKRFLREAQESL